LKKEISSLENRLERQLKESQRKIDEERKISMDAVEKLRRLENSEESLRVTVENLAKKVEFFKEKSLEACGTPQRYKSGKGQKVMLRGSSSTKTLIKKSGNQSTSSKMSNLALKVRHLKDNFKREKYQITQQMAIFKKSLKTGLRMLILQVNDQNRAIKYIQRELNQARKDLKHYENAMTEADISSIRLSSKRYLKEMVANNTGKLSTQSFQMKTPKANLGYEEIKAGVHSISAQNYSEYPNGQKIVFLNDSSNKQSPSLAYSTISPHERKIEKTQNCFESYKEDFKGNYDVSDERRPFGQRKDSMELERESAKLCRRMAELRNKEMMIRERKFGFESENFSSIKKPQEIQNPENAENLHNFTNMPNSRKKKIEGKNHKSSNSNIFDRENGRDDWIHEKYYGGKDDYFSNYESKQSYVRSSFDSNLMKRSVYTSEGKEPMTFLR